MKRILLWIALLGSAASTWAQLVPDPSDAPTAKGIALAANSLTPLPGLTMFATKERIEGVVRRGIYMRWIPPGGFPLELEVKRGEPNNSADPRDPKYAMDVCVIHWGNDADIANPTTLIVGGDRNHTRCRGSWTGHVGDAPGDDEWPIDVPRGPCGETVCFPSLQAVTPEATLASVLSTQDAARGVLAMLRAGVNKEEGGVRVRSRYKRENEAAMGALGVVAGPGQTAANTRAAGGDDGLLYFEGGLIMPKLKDDQDHDYPGADLSGRTMNLAPPAEDPQAAVEEGVAQLDPYGGNSTWTQWVGVYRRRWYLWPLCPKGLCEHASVVMVRKNNVLGIPEQIKFVKCNHGECAYSMGANYCHWQSAYNRTSHIHVAPCQTRFSAWSTFLGLWPRHNGLDDTDREFFSVVGNVHKWSGYVGSPCADAYLHPTLTTCNGCVWACPGSYGEPTDPVRQASAARPRMDPLVLHGAWFLVGGWIGFWLGWYYFTQRPRRTRT